MTSARLWGLILVSFVVALGADYFLVGDQHRPEFWGSGLRASFAVLGLVACVLIIVLSKWLGHRWLMKDEDYFTKGDGRD